MKVTIVILNFNGANVTKECVESLKKASGSFEIIIVDNGSTDGSDKILSKIKGITFLQNKENLGYSGGNNSGIKVALKNGAEAVLVLNNDTIVEKDFLINLLRATKKADVISPKIYFAPGFEFHKDRYKLKDLGKVIWFAGGKIDWNNIMGIHLGVDEVDNGQFEKQKEIEFATGACMLIKSEVFKKIGLFDEKYFLYLEDMDFSRRVKLAGFKIYFEPSSVIWHKNASTSGGSGSLLQDYFITRNRLLFSFKYAKFRTKIAVFRQIFGSYRNNTKRRALIDFLTLQLGKGSFLK